MATAHPTTAWAASYRWVTGQVLEDLLRRIRYMNCWGWGRKGWAIMPHKWGEHKQPVGPCNQFLFPIDLLCFSALWTETFSEASRTGRMANWVVIRWHKALRENVRWLMLRTPMSQQLVTGAWVPTLPFVRCHTSLLFFLTDLVESNGWSWLMLHGFSEKLDSLKEAPHSSYFALCWSGGFLAARDLSNFYSTVTPHLLQRNMIFVASVQ